MSIFNHKKTNTTAEPVYPYGFQLAEQPATKCSNRSLICAFKGFLIFAASFGTIGSVISCFSLPCHLMTILLILFFFSIGMAFMHYSRFVFNVCYPALFVMFAYMIFQFRYQVNSGFQAFVSILQRRYSDYYNLSIYREVTEMFSDRTMTITCAAIFIGFFLCILLNIAISEYMSLPLVFLMTFPIVQLGIYIRILPDTPYLVLLLFAYFTVYLLHRGEHFLMPYRDKKKTDFAYVEKRSLVTHRYHASGKNIAQITALFFLFCLLCGIVWLPFSTLTQTDSKRIPLRAKADDYMEILVQSGLSGLFNRYEATGGINEGRLGGVSGVRPDYQTDLTVTFVPYAYESLYLKAYTGSVYTGDSFEPAEYDISALTQDINGEYEAYNEYTAFLESRRFAYYTHQKEGQGLYGKMKIENVDANPNVIYYPYYTSAFLNTDYSVNRGAITGSAPVGSNYTLMYYPLMRGYWKINTSPDELIASFKPGSKEENWIRQYDMQNIIHNLETSEEIRDFVDSVRDEIGQSLNTAEQIALIQSYLKENYTYSMSPGTTPLDKDFVVYFLKDQKKGYCSHFAAAATMILRCYDIPARYVEGYCVPITEITNASAISEEYDDWIEGDNPLGKTGVITVEVTDACAHAWVEVYLPGIGWVPYEFTPPSDEEEVGNDYSDFWDLFSGLFGVQNPNRQNNLNGNVPDTQLEDAPRFDTIARESFLWPLLLFFLCFVLAGLVWYLIHSLRPQLLRNQQYQNGDFAPLLSYHYQKLCQRYHALKPDDEFILPTDFATLPLLHKELSASYTEEMLSEQMLLLETALYGKKNITKKEADGLLLFLQDYYKALKKYKN